MDSFGDGQVINAFWQEEATEQGRDPEELCRKERGDDERVSPCPGFWRVLILGFVAVVYLNAQRNMMSVKLATQGALGKETVFSKIVFSLTRHSSNVNSPATENPTAFKTR